MILLKIEIKFDKYFSCSNVLCCKRKFFEVNYSRFSLWTPGNSCVCYEKKTHVKKFVNNKPCRNKKKKTLATHHGENKNAVHKK